MVAIPPTADHLRGLIGRSVDYHGRRLKVVEVLTDGPALVLEQVGGSRAIHGNQFGEPGRRSPETWTLPVLDTDGRGLHPLMEELGLMAADDE